MLTHRFGQWCHIRMTDEFNSLSLDSHPRINGDIWIPRNVLFELAREEPRVCRGPAGAAGGRGPERSRATRTERLRFRRERADASALIDRKDYTVVGYSDCDSCRAFVNALSDSSWLLKSTSIRHTVNEGITECATEVGKPFIHNSNPQRIIRLCRC